MVEFINTPDAYLRNGSESDALLYNDEVIKPIILVELNFKDELDASDPIHACSGLNDIVYDGDTYQALAGFMEVSSSQEGLDLKAYGIEVTFDGIPSERITRAFDYTYREQKATLWLGLLDANYDLVAITVIFKGRINDAELITGKTGKVKFSIENSMIDWERPQNQKWTHASHQKEYPGDMGFEYLAETVDKEILWGPNAIA